MPLRPRRPVTRAVTGVVVVAAGLATVLAGEVVIAGRGPRVDEFDPHAADGIVVPSGAAAHESVDPVHVVWLGDSTAAGVGASGPEHSVAVRVARASSRPVRLENRAVSGARLAGVEQQAVGLPVDVDIVYVSAGANDVTHLTRLADVRASYERVLASVPAGATIVVLGVPAMHTATRLAQPLRWLAGAQGRRVDAVVREVAAGRGATYVDIAGETGPAFAADPDRHLAADRYHPSDEGYGVWADAVIAQLPERLRQPAG